MEKLDKDTIKLIEELCQKEVERTGLPLVLNKDTILGTDYTLFFHQEMQLDVKDFDSIVLTNQNDLSYKKGKWIYKRSSDEFYGYQLIIEQDGYVFNFYLDSNCLPAKNEIIKRLSSEEFKKIFDRQKKKKGQIRKLEDDIQEIRYEAAIYLKSKKEQ